MIQREAYLQQLINFKDIKLIKIITGIRRCGKSTLFDIYSFLIAVFYKYKISLASVVYAYKKLLFIKLATFYTHLI